MEAAKDSNMDVNKGEMISAIDGAVFDKETEKKLESSQRVNPIRGWVGGRTTRPSPYNRVDPIGLRSI